MVLNGLDPLASDILRLGVLREGRTSPRLAFGVAVLSEWRDYLRRVVLVRIDIAFIGEVYPFFTSWQVSAIELFFLLLVGEWVIVWLFENVFYLIDYLLIFNLLILNIL